MKKVIISPPFGTYLPHIIDADYVRGSYTHEPRPGAVLNALKYFRRTPRGWANRQGLRNPGIESQNFNRKDTIWSLAGLSEGSWMRCINSVPESARVELNFSCPNVDDVISPKTKRTVIGAATAKFDEVIVKLPSGWEAAFALYGIAREQGVDAFHATNTVKSYYGALSGKAVQGYTLSLISFLYREGVTTRIAGGGLYEPLDIKVCRDAGATNFSLCTIFVEKPWNVPAVLREINK